MVFSEYVSNEVAACEEIDEALKTRWVFRKGKKVKKWYSTKTGKFRVQFDANGKPREVRITKKERRNRQLAWIKSAGRHAAAEGRKKRHQTLTNTAKERAGQMKYNKKNPIQNVARAIENGEEGSLK